MSSICFVVFIFGQGWCRCGCELLFFALSTVPVLKSVHDKYQRLIKAASIHACDAADISKNEILGRRGQMA